MRKKIKSLINFVFDIPCLFTPKKYRFKHNDSKSNKLNILASGPSLKQSLDEYGIDYFAGLDCFVVNDMSQLDCYELIKPRYYAMADPVYWMKEEQTNECDVAARNKTFAAILSKTTWDVSLFVHRDAYNNKDFIERFKGKHNITIKPITFFNLKSDSGTFQNFAYSHNFAAPSANVLCMAIFCALNLNYKNINIFGADHSWIPDIRVNDKNQVCTIKRHIGEEDSELIPWRKVNKEIFTLPEILKAMFYTFDNYHRLQSYAKHLNCRIVNCTPDSFIDAFERK